MTISDEAVEAAAKAMAAAGYEDWYRVPDPLRRAFRRDARIALEAAAPHMLAREPGSAMREAMEIVWDQAIDACQEESALTTGAEARKLKDANPYRSQS